MSREQFHNIKHNYFSYRIGDDCNIVFHSFMGEPFYLKNEELSQLETDKLEIENVDFSESVLVKCIHCAEKYIERYSGPYVLDLIISEQCNLGCHMCFHATTLTNCDKRSEKAVMPFDLAKRWVDFYLAYARVKELDVYSFHFGAAEPFLHRDVLWKVIDYIYEIAKDKPIECFINSNLTLLTDLDIQKIKEHSIRVAVGVDGLYDVNDRIRFYRNSHVGTFNDIVTNIQKLIDNNIQVGINVTLTDRNFADFNAKETIDFFNNLGIKHMLIDSDMVTHISYSAEEIVEKYMDFLRCGEAIGMEINGSWRTPFDMLTTENTEVPKAFCASQLGKNITITPSQGLSFCTYSSQILALDDGDNIDDIFVDFKSQMKKLMSKWLLERNAECQGCPIEGVCLGGCQLSHETHGNNNFMCDIYTEATAALLKYYCAE